MEALILTNIHRILWASIKAFVLVMLFYYLYDSVLVYPLYPEKGEFIGKLFSWLYLFISSNWESAIFLFILGYSWASYRINKITARRVEQLEVIAFSQLGYFLLDIDSTKTGKDMGRKVMV